MDRDKDIPRNKETETIGFGDTTRNQNCSRSSRVEGVEMCTQPLLGAPIPMMQTLHK